MITRQIFQMVATTINSTFSEAVAEALTTNEADYVAGVQNELIAAFTEQFKQANPRFDSHKFFCACTKDR